MSNVRDDEKIIDFSKYKEEADKAKAEGLEFDGVESEDVEAGAEEDEIEEAGTEEVVAEEIETGEAGAEELVTEEMETGEAGAEEEFGDYSEEAGESDGFGDDDEEPAEYPEDDFDEDDLNEEEVEDNCDESDNTLIFPGQPESENKTSHRNIKKVLVDAIKTIALILLVAGIFAAAIIARDKLNEAAENADKQNTATGDTAEAEKVSKYPWWDERDTAEGVNLATAGNADKSDNGQVDIGDRVLFGTYNQGENGEVDKISWIVLDVQKDYILMSSEYVLDVMPYSTYGINRWEDSDVREWLNESFYNQAFSNKEKNSVMRFEIENQDNSMYNTKSGRNTDDLVFLLSLEDMNNYFGSLDVKSRATPYAQEKGVRVGSNGYSMYWLSSPGGKDLTDSSHGYAAYVDNNGKINNYGNDVTATVIGIRPAIFIKNN